MITHWTDKDRLLSLETPLGADKLLLRSFTGTEEMSRLFRFDLDLVSENHNVDFDKLVGQNVTFGISLYQMGKSRYFNGCISRLSQLPGEQRLAQYQAEVVPWLWFLTRTADCRIFQNKSVPDIVETVFQDNGFSDYELQLQGSYEPWDYCVQYRETAFNFVSRLLEQEGIFYFFRHEKGKHTLVLADSPSAHKPCPEQPSAFCERTTGPGALGHEDVVHGWRFQEVFCSGKYAATDYNFEFPSADLQASTGSCINQGGNTRFEIFDYPGEYETRNQGDQWTKLRMEEEEAGHELLRGESNCRALVSGFKLDIAGFERRDKNGSYVLTSITHKGEEGGLHSGRGSGDAKYANSFTAIPAAVPFRPRRITRKSLVYGAQTAVVVGPSGEEIYCDKHGRVKVQFHWDRRGTRNEKSSCWVRVSHGWAGKNWGAVSIPRIGQEVIVDFLEGDPDRPIITGRVYNAEQMPPYDLPANQTQTGIKSRSSKGGNGANFNEIRMEDKKGNELLYVHAEKDKNVVVENDRSESVGHDEKIAIGNDRTESVGRDETLSIERDQTGTIGRNRTRSVGKDETVAISENRTATIGKNEEVTVGENRTHSVGKDDQLDVGKVLRINAGDEIVLRTGSASIVMKKDGTIQIKGKDITATGSGKIGIKASSDVTIKGSKIMEN